MKFYHSQNLSAIENVTSDSSWVFIESIIFVIIYVVIFLIGLSSNSVVILVYLFNRKFKNNLNYLFANLSISAFLVLTLCVPIAIADLLNNGYWKLGFFYCKCLFSKLYLSSQRYDFYFTRR